MGPGRAWRGDAEGFTSRRGGGWWLEFNASSPGTTEAHGGGRTIGICCGDGSVEGQAGFDKALSAGGKGKSLAPTRSGEHGTGCGAK